jgi:arsenate reductase
LPAREWVRAGEPEYRQAGLTPDAGDEAILAAMARYPVLIERPILILSDGAVVGRPPDRVLKLLDGDL